MTLMDVRTRPRSLEELAEETGVAVEMLRLFRRRRGKYGWPFVLTPKGFVLSESKPDLLLLLSIVRAADKHTAIQEVEALVAALELKESSL